MNRLTTLLELARNGKQFKVSLLTESVPIGSARARGAILGERISNQPSLKQAESFPQQEEAVLSTLLELSANDSASPLKSLCEEVFYGDTRRLERVLRRMHEKGVISLEKGADGELAAKLTLKGAVIALYGDWLLETSHNNEQASLLQIQPSNAALKSQRHA